MSLLTKNDVGRIISKYQYWNEVAKREGVNAGEILKQELWGEISCIGLFTVLKILAEYAKSQREAS